MNKHRKTNCLKHQTPFYQFDWTRFVFKNETKKKHTDKNLKILLSIFGYLLIP